MTEATKVLVVDDHPLFRAALEVALMKSNIDATNIESVGCVADAVTALKTDQYSLALLDPWAQVARHTQQSFQLQCRRYWSR